VAELLRYRGRSIDTADVEFLRALVAEHSTASRRALSVAVCEAWDWKQANGVLEEALVDGLIAEYHYLGFARPVGEHLKYLVTAGGRPIACFC
jgi:hypothetical protein